MPIILTFSSLKCQNHQSQGEILFVLILRSHVGSLNIFADITLTPFRNKQNSFCDEEGLISYGQLSHLAFAK